jgi:purine catabolism regulator
MRRDFTISDLLADPDFNLTLATDSAPEALTRPVLGAHSIEIENPARWLEPGWMMLTMGVRLRNRPALQRQLVSDLKDLNASCLGFGLGLAFKSVPPALLDEANKRGLPVIAVPADTQFRELTRAVFESTVGVDSATFRRLSSIQQNLVRGFGDENPLESIVRRLGRLVSSVVVVATESGETIAATGAFPLADIIPELTKQYLGVIMPIAVSGWHILASPINDQRGPLARWLIVASQRAPGGEDLSRAAMQMTLPLLDAQMRISITARDQDRAIRKSLLDSILDTQGDGIDRRILSEQVGAVGLSWARGVRVMVVQADATDRGGDALSEAAEHLSERLEELSVRHLLSRRTSEVVVATDAAEHLDKLTQELVAGGARYRIGFGRPATSLDGITTAWRDAQIAVRHLAVQGSDTVLAFEDLDLVTQILAEVPEERLGGKVASMSRMLREQPIQMEALRAYFAHNRDIKAAAAALFLHPNTLRYRLERFESALGRSLQEPVVIASLYCLLTLMPEDEVLETTDPAQLAPQA